MDVPQRRNRQRRWLRVLALEVHLTGGQLGKSRPTIEQGNRHQAIATSNKGITTGNKQPVVQKRLHQPTTGELSGGVYGVGELQKTKQCATSVLLPLGRCRVLDTNSFASIWNPCFIPKVDPRSSTLLWSSFERTLTQSLSVCLT